MTKRRKRNKKKSLSKGWTTLAVVIGVIALLIGRGLYEQRDISGAAVDMEVHAEGKVIYDTYCASCHGPSGEGQLVSPAQGQAIAPPHDSTGHTWHHPDDYLISVTANGGSVSMPAFGTTLTDSEIDAVLDYIKTFWTPAQRQQQSNISQ